MSTRDMLRLWFGLSLPVDRRAYALSGFGLLALKYSVDAAVIWGWAGVRWTPLDYLNPTIAAKQPLTQNSEWWWIFIALWAIPFVWIGLSMTMRRAANAGLSPWMGLVFLLPLLNYGLMLLLCLLPTAATPRQIGSHGAGGLPRSRGDTDWGQAFVAAGGAAILGVAMTSFSVFVAGGYGMGLFIGTPFAMGFVCAFSLNRGALRSSGATIRAALLSLLLCGGALLLFALEGVFCIAMAFPPAALATLLGAWIGRAVASQSPVRASSLIALLALLPIVTGAEAVRRGAPLREVATAIEVAAPPEAVWQNVVEFGELPPPARWVFRLGIAHPVRAQIRGRGVGAVRECEFSTGAFVEPITRWEQPHRLSFDVTAQPEPMHEWSPYREVNAPHLLDGLRSRRGEFRLVALPGGRTRLEGSTWYQVDMFPQAYWSLWSDALIHRIHDRVLEHVKRLTEGAASAG